MGKTMNRAGRAALSVASNVAMLWVLFGGFWHYDAGLRNIAIFMIWLNLIAGLAASVDEVAKEALADGRPIPKWLSGSFMWAGVAILVYTGHWVLGLAVFVAHCGYSAGYDKAAKAVAA